MAIAKATLKYRGKDEKLNVVLEDYKKAINRISAHVNERLVTSPTIEGHVAPIDTGEIPKTGVPYEMLWMDGSKKLYWGWPGTGNVLLGDGVANGATQSNLRYNVFIGYEAGHTMTSYASEYGNIAIGYQAGYKLDATYAQYNVLIGNREGYNLTSGSNNVFIGTTNQVGGPGALTTGHDNILVGLKAGASVTTGSNNVMIGPGPGSLSLTVEQSVFIGRSCGNHIHAGYSNVAIGNQCLVNPAGRTLNYCIAIGEYADVGDVNATGRIALGHTAASDTDYKCRIGGTGAQAVALEIAGQYISILANGTAPFVLASSTLNTNLNADLWDGLHIPALSSGLYLTNNGATLSWGTPAAAAHQLDGALHTVSGLTDGHFLKALSATTFGFEAHGLTYSDVGASASGHNHSGVYEPVLGNPATTGFVLASTDAGVRSWVALTSAAHDILSATHGDAAASAVTRGDIIIGSVAAPNTKWTRLALGASGTYLAGSATEPLWATLNQAAISDLTTSSNVRFAK